MRPEPLCSVTGTHVDITDTLKAQLEVSAENVDEKIKYKEIMGLILGHTAGNTDLGSF